MKSQALKNKDIFLLIGSRIYYRLAFLILNITLFYVWESQIYGNYVAKVGTWAVLQPLVAIGIGKCALKLLTLYERLKGHLLRDIIRISIVISLIMNLLVIAFNVIWKSIFKVPLDVLDISIGFYSTLVGYSLALQSIGRGLKRNIYDYGLSLVLGTLVLLLCFINLLRPVTPIQLVLLLIAIFLAANSVSLHQLLKAYPAKKPIGRRAHRFTALRVWKEAMVMGFNSLIGNATFSVVSIAFRFYELYEAAGYFNLVISVGGFGLAFFEYLLKLFLPKATFLAYNDKKYTSADYLKKYINRSIFIIFLSLSVALIVACFIPEKLFYLFLLWFCLAPVFMLNELIIFWFEAVSRKELINTIYGCTIGLLICSVLIFTTLPFGKASGAMLVLGTAEMSTSFYLIASFKKNNRKKNLLEEGSYDSPFKELQKNRGG